MILLSLDITIMLNMFFEYLTERPFLMKEYPMKNWENNVEHVDGAEISTENLKELSPIVNKGCAENDRPDEGAANPINDLNEDPALPIDDAGHPEEEYVATEGFCDDTGVQSSLSPSLNVEINDNCSADHHPNNEGAAQLVDITNCAAENLISETGSIPSLGEAHPSWNNLTFQSSMSRSGRNTKLKMTAKEKAHFDTNVFNAFFGVIQENISSKAYDRKTIASVRNGIFFGLNIFFEGN